jgi:DNA replication and repair protein RecF
LHRAKNCPADLCSTGEQKTLLIALMLAYVRLLIDERGMTPLFLLDDIVAHLDDTRRTALFEEIISLGAQAWLTGTDLENFTGLASHAQIVEIDNGMVH